MKVCFICGKENDNIICEQCKSTKELKNKIVQSFKEYQHNTLCLNEDILNEILKYLKSPDKEYVTILSLSDNHYAILKNNREWLIENAHICLESNELTSYEKNQVYTSLLNAYYRNFEFFEAEKIASKLINEKDIDASMLYTLGDYYILTRRYDISLNLLNKALRLTNNYHLKNDINKKINECESRKLGKENGGSSAYLPSSQENKIKYQHFMEELGISIRMLRSMLKPKETFYNNISIKPIEITQAGFNSFVAFDVETTGINFHRDCIIELSAIKVINGKIVEKEDFIFQELVLPYKKKIPPEVESLTGITNQMVKYSRDIWEVFPEFVKFVGDNILVGYNCMRFDSKFFIRASKVSNVVLKNKYFDVMNYVSKFKIDLNYENRSLNNIAKKLSIINPNAHRSLSDAITTAKIYLKLLEMEKEKGIVRNS